MNFTIKVARQTSEESDQHRLPDLISVVAEIENYTTSIDPGCRRNLLLAGFATFVVSARKF